MWRICRTPIADGASLGGQTILVVEDDRKAVELIRLYVERADDWATSVPGSSATFCFTLPVAAQAHALPTEPALSQAPAHAPAGQLPPPRPVCDR